MKKTKIPEPPSVLPLRAMAEKQLASLKPAPAPAPAPAPSTEKLLHELQVHQIELEMQNESLRHSQSELEAALERNFERYADLYEFAPVGYLTLSPTCQILEANLTAARMLGAVIKDLLMRRFDHWVAEADIDQWHRFFMRAMSGSVEAPFTLQMRGAEDSPQHVQIIFRRIHPNSGTPLLRLALTDINQIKQIEQRLRDSEESLRMALNYSPNAILIANPNGFFTYANHRAKALYGYTLEEFETLNIADTLAPEVKHASLANFQRNLAGSHEFFETTILNKQGQRIEVEISGVRLPAGDVLGEVRDITEIKQNARELARYRDHLEHIVAERSQQMIQLYQELGKHQQLLQSIIDNAPASIFVKDMEGRYLLANQRYIDKLNIDIDANAIIGRRDQDFFTAHAAIARQTVDIDLISTQTMLEYEEVVPQADGLHTWLSHKFPLYDADGAVYAICGVSNDISEHKRAQEAINLNEARLKEAQRIAHIGNWDFDLQQNRLVWSDELYRIYEIDPAQREPNFDLVMECTHPEDREAFAHAFSKSIAEHAFFEHNSRLIMSDGRIKYLSNRGETHYLSDRTPYRSIGTTHDITEQKQAEQQLHALQQELEQTLRFHAVNQTIAAIAHELHQPLSAISAYSQAALRLIKTGNKQPEKLIHALESSVMQAQRAGTVVRELLNFMRQTSVETHAIDINEIVKTALSKVRIDKTITFHPLLSLDHNLKAVRANSLQIEKVLINLIQNGIEAMLETDRRPCQISISTRVFTDPNQAEICLQDSGPGIEDTILQRIFDPFFTTKSDGLGMGLPISRAIIEAHGGQLWAESPPETGVRFHLTLPFAVSPI
jgi:two-component system, LuxR family, sensor kinase FixL